MAQFTAELSFDHSLETVFAFHTQPHNLLRMAPEGIQVEVAEAPPIIGPGSEMEFRFSAYGFAKNLRMKVLEFQLNALIVDEQIRGPLKKWKQQHRFEPHPQGGTKMIYEVEFLPPGGMMGLMITEERILTGLRKGMPYRQQRTRELLDQASQST